MRITETFEDMRFSTKVREILSAEVDGLARRIDREVAAFGLYTDWYSAIGPSFGIHPSNTRTISRRSGTLLVHAGVLAKFRYADRAQT